MRLDRQQSCREGGMLVTISEPMDHDRRCHTPASVHGGLPTGPEA
jgi:hypothetical protein